MAHQLALEQLELGMNVIVECVNPIALTRDAWLSTAARAEAALVEVEVSCTDQAEHRRRVETRHSDVDGLVKPIWDQVVNHEYEPWSRRIMEIDSSTVPVAGAVQQLVAELMRAHED